MTCASAYLVFTLLCLQSSIFCSLAFHNTNVVDTKVLNVGEELEGEILPLRMGRRLYQLHGLMPSTWYEVKISYPASIPASFSIHLIRNASELGFGKNRRLLNTEKLIFQANINKLESDHSETYALLTVEAGGVVAKPGVQERETVLFNIVCDELSLGIPCKAWWVGAVAILCLVLAAVIPYFFPSYLLLNNQMVKSNSTAMKDS